MRVGRPRVRPGDAVHLRGGAGEAAAQSPNAPSTCTQAPWSLAQATSGPNGSLAPLLTLPACRQTIAGPSSAGRSGGDDAALTVRGQGDDPVAAEADQAEGLADGGVRLGAGHDG